MFERNVTTTICFDVLHGWLFDVFRRLVSSRKLAIYHPGMQSCLRVRTRIFHCFLLIKFICISIRISLRTLLHEACDPICSTRFHSLSGKGSSDGRSCCNTMRTSAHRLVNLTFLKSPKRPLEWSTRWKIRFMFVEKLSKRCCITLRVL